MYQLRAEVKDLVDEMVAELQEQQHFLQIF